ncbi:MAG: carboxypeptidase-like regulatory domain-containing protein [Bryobacteraceae bacterium]
MDSSELRFRRPSSVTEMQTGISRSVPTNQSGAYVASNLAAGRYLVAVTHEGFRKLTRENVDVLVNTTVRVDLELQPGSVNESVTVSSDAPVADGSRT